MIRPRTVAVLAIVGAWLAATLFVCDVLVWLLGWDWAYFVVALASIPNLALLGWTLDALPREPDPPPGAYR